MQYIPLIATVSLLNLLAAISPGPDFVMCVKNSLNYSRRTGIFTGFGIGLGLSVHITYCAAGIGLLISKSIIAFTIIKFLGAGYLLYMGIGAFLAKSSKINLEEEKKTVDLTRLQAIKIGFLTNVLNPKATLFFLSLFTFVVSKDTPLIVLLIIAFIMIATAIAWFTVVAIFFSHQKIKDGFMRFEKAINRVFGGILILLGIKIALAHK